MGIGKERFAVNFAKPGQSNLIPEGLPYFWYRIQRTVWGTLHPFNQRPMLRFESYQGPEWLSCCYQILAILHSCNEELIDLDLWSRAGDGAGDGVGNDMVLQAAMINLGDVEVQRKLLKRM
ncbi:unnamed protein product [Rangifer tarandus platyrhynchus]|uniref:Uncharacterized protein n=2 Tax=Rangifer tarandus platyrhynchus TaxID=3082113 RepID=A0ACB0F553_RANTA|nr:unnamed protein product [Rangifer tarandus platyrhynchus]CAI9707429.1 unnamed protein product [Rangifer tarandus platyrhynchus]